MGRNLLRHASLGLYNHFDSHEAEYCDIIFNYCSDLLPYQYYMWARVCVSHHYPNNANPSIFFTVNKLHYTLCSCVHVCLVQSVGWVKHL